ncbi:hypothetical protein [Citrobacter freundii]|uniref:hypothetical protein n=1 Tax=Citrobacter freundii TaxID=546 RepID=UPI00291F50BD|nr:hypothetical protein RHA96_14130 [Citrobacter freundii]
MSTISREQQKQILIDTAHHVINRDNTSPYSENLRELARIALASIEAEPVCYLTWHQGFRAPDDCEEYVVEAKPGDKSCDGSPAFPVYAAPPVPVSVPDVHHSVIAEQLAHVLSSMDATDHQRAVISCAVDRLNKVSQLLQASPSALLVPEMLDYQGAKELYNYLMTEEETNATVNGWNACLAAMFHGAYGNSPVIPDGWVACSDRMPEDG